MDLFVQDIPSVLIVRLIGQCLVSLTWADHREPHLRVMSNVVSDSARCLAANIHGHCDISSCRANGSL